MNDLRGRCFGRSGSTFASPATKHASRTSSRASRDDRDGVPAAPARSRSLGEAAEYARHAAARLRRVHDPGVGQTRDSREPRAPSPRAARSASAARMAAEPRVPISPSVRSSTPVRWPCAAALDQRAAAGELRIVPVRGDREYVQIGHAGKLYRSGPATRSAGPRSGPAAPPVAPAAGRRRCRCRPTRPPRRGERAGGAASTFMNFVSRRRPAPSPNAMPITPPMPVSVAASIEELQHDVAARRAERLAHADLARAIGDRDHHDRHHADAADHQRRPTTARSSRGRTRR